MWILAGICWPIKKATQQWPRRPAMHCLSGNSDAVFKPKNNKRVSYRVLALQDVLAQKISTLNSWVCSQLMFYPPLPTPLFHLVAISHYPRLNACRTAERRLATRCIKLFDKQYPNTHTHTQLSWGVAPLGGTQACTSHFRRSPLEDPLAKSKSYIRYMKTFLQKLH